MKKRLKRATMYLFGNPPRTWLTHLECNEFHKSTQNLGQLFRKQRLHAPTEFHVYSTYQGWGDLSSRRMDDKDVSINSYQKDGK